MFLEDISNVGHVDQKLYTFSEVSVIKLLPDMKTLLLGTIDGILMKVKLFEEKIVISKDEDDKKILSSLHKEPK
jgi:hypothetical protein